MIYAALCLIGVRWSTQRSWMILLGILAGLFAQSRLPIIGLLLILGLGIWRRNRLDARWMMTAALTTCGTLYLFFYLWTVRDHVFFQPLHLLHRERASGLAATLIGLLSGVIVVAWILLKMKGSSPDWILAGGLLLLTVFGSTGLGELARVLPHVDAWEGANYLSFGISLIAAYLALMVGEPGGRPMPTHPDGTLLDQAV